MADVVQCGSYENSRHKKIRVSGGLSHCGSGTSSAIFFQLLTHAALLVGVSIVVSKIWNKFKRNCSPSQHVILTEIAVL